MCFEVSAKRPVARPGGLTVSGTERAPLAANASHLNVHHTF